MKKLITILMILAMLFGLCASAMALEILYVTGEGFEAISTQTQAPEGEGVTAPSVEYVPVGIPVADGYHLEIRMAKPENVDEGTLEETASQSPPVVRAGELASLEVLEIVVVRDSDGEVVEWPLPITVTVRLPDWILAAFVQNADRSWTEVSFDYGDEEGIVTLYFPHLSPVAFAVAEKRGSESGTGDGQVVTSPQTGYDTLPWALLALVFTAGAAVCLVRAKKAGR